jgi:hypothetical protein
MPHCAQERPTDTTVEGDLRQAEGARLHEFDAVLEGDAPTSRSADASESGSGILRPEPAAEAPAAADPASPALSDADITDRLSITLADAEGCPKASGRGAVIKLVPLSLASKVINVTEVFFKARGEK